MGSYFVNMQDQQDRLHPPLSAYSAIAWAEEDGKALTILSPPGHKANAPWPYPHLPPPRSSQLVSPMGLWEDVLKMEPRQSSANVLELMSGLDENIKDLDVAIKAKKPIWNQMKTKLDSMAHLIDQFRYNASRSHRPVKNGFQQLQQQHQDLHLFIQTNRIIREGSLSRKKVSRQREKRKLKLAKCDSNNTIDKCNFSDDDKDDFQGKSVNRVSKPVIHQTAALCTCVDYQLFEECGHVSSMSILEEPPPHL